MATFYKQGAIGSLQPVVVKCRGRIAALYEKHGKDLMITSLRDGYHSHGSLHPDGWAFDFRKNGVPLEEIKEAAGPGFDVLLSNDGAVHCEFDNTH